MKTVAIKETISSKGKPLKVDAVRIGEQTYIISGRLIRTASLKNDWQEDVRNPAEIASALKNCPLRVDLLKFWQRLPETEPKYSYYKEWQSLAAIPITTYEHWWDKQIRFRARNKIRKAEKLGVVIKEDSLTDDFVKGVMGIYNQSPTRRGKPFRHYGKPFATVKAALAMDIESAVFIGAYHDGELVGFIKLQVDDRYARITLILDKTLHRDKSPTNGLVAKAVQICADKNIRYLTYYAWRRGDHGRFQESVGFEKIAVPEYFVSLSLRGRLALFCKMHRGLQPILPEKLVTVSLALRSRWYTGGNEKLSPLGGKATSSIAS